MIVLLQIESVLPVLVLDLIHLATSGVGFQLRLALVFKETDAWPVSRVII